MLPIFLLASMAFGAIGGDGRCSLVSIFVFAVLGDLHPRNGPAFLHPTVEHEPLQECLSKMSAIQQDVRLLITSECPEATRISSAG